MVQNVACFQLPNDAYIHSYKSHCMSITESSAWVPWYRTQPPFALDQEWRANLQPGLVDGGGGGAGAGAGAGAGTKAGRRSANDAVSITVQSQVLPESDAAVWLQGGRQDGAEAVGGGERCRGGGRRGSAGGDDEAWDVVRVVVTVKAKPLGAGVRKAGGSVDVCVSGGDEEEGVEPAHTL